MHRPTSMEVPPVPPPAHLAGPFWQRRRPSNRKLRQQAGKCWATHGCPTAKVTRLIVRSLLSDGVRRGSLRLFKGFAPLLHGTRQETNEDVTVHLAKAPTTATKPKPEDNCSDIQIRRQHAPFMGLNRRVRQMQGPS